MTDPALIAPARLAGLLSDKARAIVPVLKKYTRKEAAKVDKWATSYRAVHKK